MHIYLRIVKPRGACRSIYSALLALWILGVGTSAFAVDDDPFDRGATMPAGRFRGGLLDTTVKRNIELLSFEAAKKYDPKEGELVFANFLSEGKYWIAKLPQGAVEDAILQVERYAPRIAMASHVQVRFKLKPGKELELYPQVGSELPRQPKVNDIIFSAQTTMTKSQTFNIVKGLFNRYALVLRLVNSKDIFDAEVNQSKHRVEQIRIQLDDAKKSAFLENAIWLSDRYGLNHMYNSLRKSCVTILFQLLDHIVPPKFLKWSRNHYDQLPNHIRKYLAIRGLLDPTTRGAMSDWNQEGPPVAPAGSCKDAIVTRILSEGM